MMQRGFWMCFTSVALLMAAQLAAEAAVLVADEDLARVVGGCPNGYCVTTDYCRPPGHDRCEDGHACMGCATKDWVNGMVPTNHTGCMENHTSLKKCKNRQVPGCGNKVKGGQCQTHLWGTTCWIQGGTYDAASPCGTMQTKCFEW